jgi:uncharacterized protein (TIGR02996 family)
MMDWNERESFVRAVAEKWWDPLPRLVFADWLDERGDPDRAEFIRVQCELVQLKRGGNHSWRNATASSLRRRELYLLNANRGKWDVELFGNILRPIAKSVDQVLGIANRAEYRRGFVERLTATKSQWDWLGERILDYNPINELNLTFSDRDSGRNIRPYVLHKIGKHKRKIESCEWNTTTVQESRVVPIPGSPAPFYVEPVGNRVVSVLTLRFKPPG